MKALATGSWLNLESARRHLDARTSFFMFSRGAALTDGELICPGAIQSAGRIQKLMAVFWIASQSGGIHPAAQKVAASVRFG
ncbi:hypothetical protein [Parendozoicomonas haliclonae]|uniref:hypothetical protein n=1 Tax=Parendozoicomonas haliclonae TaxID=1960125 RepID=UPI0039F095D5